MDTPSTAIMSAEPRKERLAAGEPSILAGAAPAGEGRPRDEEKPTG